MKWLWSMVPLLLFPGCSPSSGEHQTGVMQVVENKLIMPPDARPWSEYARYYSAQPDGKIIGIFIIPDDPSHQNEFYNLPAGERRWVDDYRNLPAIMDGGCTVLTVMLDPNLKKREGPFCNGEA